MLTGDPSNCRIAAQCLSASGFELLDVIDEFEAHQLVPRADRVAGLWRCCSGRAVAGPPRWGLGWGGRGHRRRRRCPGLPPPGGQRAAGEGGRPGRGGTDRSGAGRPSRSLPGGRTAALRMIPSAEEHTYGRAALLQVVRSTSRRPRHGLRWLWGWAFVSCSVLKPRKRQVSGIPPLHHSNPAVRTR